jgi:predicted nucleic acid-binding protein
VKFLVDANVLSEPTKAVPDPNVVEWLKRHERDIAVDPIILGEISNPSQQLSTDGTCERPPATVGGDSSSISTTLCP